MKHKIIETSLNLFIKNGYQQTSVNEIIEKAKVSKGGLYHHFKSKQEILLTICDMFAEQVIRNISIDDPQLLSNQEKIQLIVNAKISSDSQVNQLLAQAIFTQDAELKQLLLSRLQLKLVPVIAKLFFDDITNVMEREAKANMLFQLTQTTLSLPEDKRENSEFLEEFTKIQMDLVNQLI